MFPPGLRVLDNMIRPFLAVDGSFLVVFSMHFFFIWAAEPSVTQLESARYLRNVQKPFFSTVSMLCDHPSLNVSTSPDVQNIFWVFPDGTNIYSTGDVDAEAYSFSSITTPSNKVLKLYNLTAIEIDEAQFGHYFCLVQYAATRVVVIRWGLNVNGADFSDLLEEYRENAIVGGIAAAALLLVVGGVCLFWNVRNSKRDEDKDDDYRDPKRDLPVVSTSEDNERVFHNTAYKQDVDDEAAVDVHM